VEVPVRWAHDPATRVRVLRDSLQMFGDLVFIRWNWLMGRYPKQPKRKRGVLPFLTAAAPNFTRPLSAFVVPVMPQ
jgi:hypothetical protein